MKILDELAPRLSPEAVLRRNEPLAKKTTLRVGGCADYYAEPASEADLSFLLQFCELKSLPFFILGRGSNLLIRDGGVRGFVICLGHPNFSRVEIVGERLHCGAGAKLKIIAQEARRMGLSGLEFLDGIPGSLGGALRMNAGAMGGAIFDRVESLRVMSPSGQPGECSVAEVPVEYRSCPLFKTHIALGAVLCGTPAPEEEIAQRMKCYSLKRWEAQPKEPSAGCTFKNPKEKAAGRLVDELGLKGTRVGGAVVSTVHGNFIINDGTATARDVLSLVDLVAKKVKAETGIVLQTEIEIIGED